MSVIIIITNINKFNELCYSELLLKKIIQNEENIH